MRVLTEIVGAVMLLAIFFYGMIETIHYFTMGDTNDDLRNRPKDEQQPAPRDDTKPG